MFCGIDVAKNKSQVCILKEDNIIFKEFEITHTKEGFDELEQNITPETTIAMETTGNYSKAIYDYFKSRYKTIYVDNGQMHMFNKLHFSHMKNDKIDARLIAKYLSFGLKKVDPIREDSMKDLGRLYNKTCMQLSNYKHMYKNQINIIFPELETHFYLSKGKAITSLLMKYPSPEQIAKLSDEELFNVLTSDFKNKNQSLPNKQKYMTLIRELASKSIGIKDYPTVGFVQTIKILRFYEETINSIKSQIKIAVLNSPYSRLVNEFGYNDLTLASIIGEVGDIRRFSNHKKFVSYCGLDISEKQSGKSMSQNCYITKRGNKILRHTFYLQVLVHLSHRKEEPFAQFFNKLKAKGKHPKQGVTAVARKLAIKCYYDLWKCHNENK